MSLWFEGYLFIHMLFFVKVMAVNLNESYKDGKSGLNGHAHRQFRYIGVMQVHDSVLVVRHCVNTGNINIMY